MIRVLVVDDSQTVRAKLIEVLSAHPEFTIVGEASNGRDAIERCTALRPDVMTLDLALPEIDGLGVTEHIMATAPTPILIVSASFNRGEVFSTYDALNAGAVDVLDKPGDGEEDWDARFIAAVRMVSRIKVITHPRGRLRPRHKPAAVQHVAPRTTRTDLVAIGASTGGPSAILDVLAGLPRSFSLPIVVVLHVDPAFATSFAEWLATRSGRVVKLAEEGAIPQAGQVMLAPPHHHLAIQNGRARLIDTPPKHHCRPSVDVLFESLAADRGASTLAALLTGMGRDGANGMLAIRRAGGHTIAQDEATCIVYGMPREAALLGAADKILPLPEIGPAIAAHVGAT